MLRKKELADEPEKHIHEILQKFKQNKFENLWLNLVNHCYFNKEIGVCEEILTCLILT